MVMGVVWAAGDGLRATGCGRRVQGQAQGPKSEYQAWVTISRSRMVSLSAMNIATSSTIAPISMASGWEGRWTGDGQE